MMEEYASAAIKNWKSHQSKERHKLIFDSLSKGSVPVDEGAAVLSEYLRVNGGSMCDIEALCRQAKRAPCPTIEPTHFNIDENMIKEQIKKKKRKTSNSK